VFRVRARDVFRHVSAEDSFAFRVLTPWYRSWWAYLLYFVALASTVWLIVMWRVFALAERNRKLERIIHERTDEIRSQRDAIKIEEEKTEALLLNILPAPVADELRATGIVNPTAYEDVTICFTDFVGFTLSSEKVSAADLVAGLHRYFTAFDEIVDRYGLEKMKTIGDSYMFVGGLPERKPSHAVDAVMAALEIIEAVVDLKRSSPHWDIRIGLHSGPVVAGVVGVRKFAFDIWGETVNFASRFESSGRPNRVNISERTHELVRDFIECEARGPVPIKEGRLLEMFLAAHIRRDLLDADQEKVSGAFAELYEQKFGYRPRAIPRVPQIFATEEERAAMRS
jgi:class 3 adenylate cyclase